MCIGIPMQVVESGSGYAVCQSRDGRQQQVDTMLVGDQAKGTWLLIFLDAAREVVDEITAHQISDALEALGVTMQGQDSVDHLFADLIEREPQLPEFLRSTTTSNEE